MHKMVDFDTYKLRKSKLTFLQGLVFFSTFSTMWSSSRDNIYAKHFGWDHEAALAYLKIGSIIVGMLISSFLIGRGR